MVISLRANTVTAAFFSIYNLGTIFCSKDYSMKAE